MPYSNPDRQREYQRNWVAQRRVKFLQDKGCVECGSIENLEIDHLDATKKVDHRVWSWSNARREEELAKCVVRCHPCHVRKSILAGEMYGPSPHGSKRMYDVHKCKCAECRAGHAQRIKNYRARVAQR